MECRVAKTAVLGLGALLPLTSIIVDSLVIDVFLIHILLERIVQMGQFEGSAEQRTLFIGIDKVWELLCRGKEHTVYHLHDTILYLLILQNDSGVAVDIVVAGDRVDIDLDEAGIHIGGAHHTIVKVCRQISYLNNMTKSYSIAVSIGKLIDVHISLLTQIDVKGFIRRSKTSVFAVGCQQLFYTSTLKDIGVPAAHSLSASFANTRCVPC